MASSSIFRDDGQTLGKVKKNGLSTMQRRPSIDSASEYFRRMEDIAGVKIIIFQALMLDILHCLGITKIDCMLNMSNTMPLLNRVSNA